VALLVGWSAIFGLVVGSFLNVVIYRVPAGLSIASPPSACPNCKALIKTRHNVPLLGWLALRGRCASCRSAISVRYPLVELATGTLFAAIAWRLSDLDLTSALPAFAWFTAAGVALAMIDLDVRRLPNVIVLPTIVVVAVLLAVASAINGHWWALARSGISGATLFAIFFALILAYPRGIGFGDVKLAPAIGLVLGYLSWEAVVVGAFLGFLLGALVGVVVIAAQGGSRKTALPFGPFMIAGALIAIFAAHPLADVYRHAFGQ